MKEDSNRTQRITIRLMPEGYARIQGKFKTTTCRKLSEYARIALLGQQHKLTPRNQQLEDFMQELIRLRAYLHGISNNFNQAAKKLHTYRQIAEFRYYPLLRLSSVSCATSTLFILQFRSFPVWLTQEGITLLATFGLHAPFVRHIPTHCHTSS